MSLATRRICLFAGYDVNEEVPDYVVLILKALSTISDVFYFSDNDLSVTEQSKLNGICTVLGHYRHNRYDFGSWACMIDALGWSHIAAYDELILVNDSCYGPITDMSVMFEAMAGRDCDFWSVTSSREIRFHLQSYFLVFKKNVIYNYEFQEFWKKIDIEKNYNAIVEKYEVGLTQLLMSNGFTPDSYIRSSINENLTNFPLTMMTKFHVPLIKVKCFSDPYIGTLERCSLSIKHLKKISPDIAIAILNHQGAGCISRMVSVQNKSPPIFCNFALLKIRSIRNSRLKISFFGRLRIIVPLPISLMRRISRLKFIKVRI